MRLIFLVVAAAPMLLAASAPMPLEPEPGQSDFQSKARCERNGAHWADEARDRATPRAQRLGELPPGELSLAVQREVGGCIEPVTVRRGYGAVFDPPESRRK